MKHAVALLTFILVALFFAWPELADPLTMTMDESSSFAMTLLPLAAFYLIARRRQHA